MKQLFTLWVMLMLVAFTLNAQNDDKKRMGAIDLAVRDSAQMWTVGGGIGADLGNILIINPKPGSGQNRIGIGGAVGLYANMLKDGIKWDNNFSLNFGLEKTGSGILPVSILKIRVPFKKTIDDLRINSTFGIRVHETSKFYYAVNFGFRSQFTPAYLGNEDGQVYLKSIEVEGPFQNTLVSQFFSPARVNLGFGIKYDPNESFSVLFTPATLDLLLISSEQIANLGLHGTELKDGSTTEYKQSRVGVGAYLAAQYTRKLLQDKLSWTSRLGLFSDYLHEPKNIDVDWTNELAMTLFKNVQLAYMSNLYYDDDVLSSVTDFDAPGGLRVDSEGNPVRRPTTNYYHQIVLRYTKVF
jgi:hypothetical protein